MTLIIANALAERGHPVELVACSSEVLSTIRFPQDQALCTQGRS